MKIRNGFVSNSSSSSFVVSLFNRGIGENKERQVTEEQEKLLKGFGFKYCGRIMPTQLELGASPRDGNTHMFYKVTVNQYEIIYWLVSKGIPFSASCHYGHESVFFEKGSSKVVTMHNIGLVREMYGPDPYDFGKNRTGMYEQSVSEILAEAEEHENSIASNYFGEEIKP
jgi:hypothetical protein